MFSTELARCMGDSYNYDQPPEYFAPSYIPQVLQPWTDALQRLTRKSFRQAPVLLDIATGGSEVIPFFNLALPKVRVLRSDISEKVLPYGQSQPFNTDAFAADCMNLPLRKESVLAVHFKDGLAHLADHAGFFKEMYRILQPGGELLLTFMENYGNVFQQIAVGRPHLVPFKTYAEYMAYYEAMSPLKDMVKIGAPYFDLRCHNLDSTLKLYGFKVLSKNKWEPEKTEKDWYSKGVLVGRHVWRLQKVV